MARSTHAAPIMVRCEDWSPDEYVMLRNIQTAGDTKWVNAHSTMAEMDKNADNGVRASLDPTAYMIAVIAKMTVKWTLQVDQVDKFGNTIFAVGEEGKTAQVPLKLPQDPDERLAVIEGLHADDMTHIFNTYMEAKQPPPSKEEQDDFLPDAKEPTVMSA